MVIGLRAVACLISIGLMTGRRKKLNETVRFRVPRPLKKSHHVSQREWAEDIGIGLGPTNYVVRALVGRAGLGDQLQGS